MTGSFATTTATHKKRGQYHYRIEGFHSDKKNMINFLLMKLIHF